MSLSIPVFLQLADPGCPVDVFGVTRRKIDFSVGAIGSKCHWQTGDSACRVTFENSEG